MREPKEPPDQQQQDEYVCVCVCMYVQVCMYGAGQDKVPGTGLDRGHFLFSSPLGWYSAYDLVLVCTSYQYHGQHYPSLALRITSCLARPCLLLF